MARTKTEGDSYERIVKIKLDDKFTLYIDSWNYWIMQTVIVGDVGKNGKKTLNAGKEQERRYGGYYTNFTDCMEAFVRKQPQFSEVKSISDLLKAEKNGKKEVENWCKDISEVLKAMQKDKKYAPLFKELSDQMTKKNAKK